MQVHKRIAYPAYCKLRRPRSGECKELSRQRSCEGERKNINIKREKRVSKSASGRKKIETRRRAKGGDNKNGRGNEMMKMIKTEEGHRRRGRKTENNRGKGGGE